MYDYIIGDLTELTPTEAVIENNNIGYKLQISLQTYTVLQNQAKTKLFIYHHLREDVELWYGFITKDERRIFLLLIDVNGIGPNTARMILSSLSLDELKTAIVAGDVNKIKGVKGIGLKTAQRLIIELKDKISKTSISAEDLLSGSTNSTICDEALSALVLLGFNKTAAGKTINTIVKENSKITLEELIKVSLKRL